MEWDKVRDEILSDQEVKEEYYKIPNPYFEGEYIYVYDDNGNQWPIKQKSLEEKRQELLDMIADYPTQPMQPIKQTKWKQAFIGLAYSSPIWIAALFVLWAVGKGRWW